MFLGFMIGVAFVLALVFASQAVQSGFQWRSDRFFKRPPATQLHFERANLALWRRGIDSTPPGQVVLLGDSHLQGMQSAALGPSVTNLSIGGVTATRVERYLSNGELRLPMNPKGIVIWLGHNDLNENVPTEAMQQAFTRTFTMLASKAPLVVVQVLSRPGRSNHPGRESLNLFLAGSCKTMAHCTWMEIPFLLEANGELKPSLVEEDGVHLNAQGYEKLIAGLKAQLKVSFDDK